MIRVLIVDHRRAARDGLKRLLATAGEISVVGETPSPAEAGEIASGSDCDVAILGLSDGPAEAIERLHRLKSACPDLRVLAVGPPAEPDLAADALRQGASGYLEMGRAREDLVRAVRLVCRGSLFLSTPLPEPGRGAKPRATT